MNRWLQLILLLLLGPAAYGYGDNGLLTGRTNGLRWLTVAGTNLQLNYGRKNQNHPTAIKHGPPNL